jgi:glutamate-1-semialdehyde aminotransferase
VRHDDVVAARLQVEFAGGAAQVGELRRGDTERFGRFFQALLANGVYLPPSQFEACFVSTEHREAEIAATLEAVEKAFR